MPPEAQPHADAEEQLEANLVRDPRIPPFTDSERGHGIGFATGSIYLQAGDIRPPDYGVN
jgi:hypothetical protein